MTALDRVCAALDHHRLPYALIGAAALAARGIARSTFDIDLLTTDRRALEAPVWATWPADAIDIRRGDVDDPLAGVVRVTVDADRPVDASSSANTRGRPRAVARAEPVSGGPPIALARDLVLLKFTPAVLRICGTSASC